MKGMLFVMTSIGLNVLGQLAFKAEMNRFGEIMFRPSRVIQIGVQIFSRPMILLGVFLYAVSAFFWIIALSKSHLSFAYPMLSIGYVLIFFLSVWLFKEPFSLIRLLGTIIVCGGVVLVARA
jgi:multidrug transporter EmrE-like cation transporter